MLCVGLDPEPSKFPAGLKGEASKIYDFCAAIVDATADLVSSFKPQIAYFAAHRAEGQLERLMEHMRRVAPQVPIILDAKRGDIGSTAEQYAKEAFERYGADAVTLSPFMGWDSVAPYLKYEGKGAFLLCRTSNPGGDDLQNQRLASVDGQPLLYEPLNRYETDLFNSQADAAGFLEDRGLGHVRLLCDLFHMNIEEPDIAATLRGLGEQVGHVHWADSNRRAMGLGHTPPGPIVATLREIGFPGHLSAEVFPLPSPAAAAAASIESFRRFVA